MAVPPDPLLMSLMATRGLVADHTYNGSLGMILCRILCHLLMSSIATRGTEKDHAYDVKLGNDSV